MKRTLLLLTLLFFYFQTYSQNKIEYSYDSAGNRVKREVIYMAKQQVSEYSEKTKPIQKQISEGTIIIYPNPTKGQISVEINGFKSSMEGSLNIYDMQGKLILKESITTTHKNLDISSSPDGIYIMTIIIDEDKHQWKIVKE